MSLFSLKVLNVAILDVVIFAKYEPDRRISGAQKVYVRLAVRAFKVGLLFLLVSYYDVLLGAKSSLMIGLCDHSSECVSTAPIGPPRVSFMSPQNNAEHVVSNLHLVPSEAWESDFDAR